MKLLSVKVKNYKSIKEEQYVELNGNINIFAGKNNTGKTALIEAIYTAVNSDLFDTMPVNSNSIVKLEIEISIDEKELDFLNQSEPHGKLLIGETRFIIMLSHAYNTNYTVINKIQRFTGMYYEDVFINNSISSISTSAAYLFEYPRTGTNFGGRPHIVSNFLGLLKKNIVFISGTRNVPKTQSTELNENLSIDGTNLNAFLYTLHNNDEETFDKIKKVFQQIFDDVTSISTPINADKSSYISLLFDGDKQPIPLYDCGSGFTHVLLLLCVLFTKENSVILFDEPHVFLHPSAEKAIYDLINETNHHQYLLTTHSPILINYPFKKNLIHVEKENGVTNYSQLNDMQRILSDIGISNSDFALSEKVLFVEGQTEEAVIPLMMDAFGMKQIGYNYRILRMGGGNEFINKSAMTRHREKLDLILSGISQSPIPYKILIDVDEKTDAKITEIREKYEDNIIILERREIENYFLKSYEVIADILKIYSGEDEVTVTPEEIQKEIERIISNTGDRNLYPRSTEEPLKNVKGSKVFEILFAEYGINYNKIIHGTELVKGILKKSPDDLIFFKEQLEDFMNK